MNRILSWFEKKRAGLQTALEQSIAGSSPKENTPSESERLRKQAGTLLAEGYLDAALDLLVRASRLNPNDALCFSNMGFIHSQKGQIPEARAALSKALELDSQNYDSHFMMGNLLSVDGDISAGLESFEKALSVKPDFSICRDSLYTLLVRERKFSEARHVLQSGFSYEQDLANYHLKAANIYYCEGAFKKAVIDLEKALKFRPNDIEILGRIAGMYLEDHEVGTAIAKCHDILRLHPNNVAALSNLGVAYLASGKYELAVKNCRKALEIDPLGLAANQNLLYMLSFGMLCSPAEYLAEAIEFGQKVSKLATPYSHWECDSSKERSVPLRVGFISGDFHQHPVGYFLESIVRYMDPSKISLIAYANGIISDSLTARIQPYFQEWNQINGLADEDLAKRIHKDAIDILIDLSGHTQFNRLPVFAWRPAPIQVSWLGYWASTGVKEIDYILVDEISAPLDEQSLYAEKLWHLPATRLCFTPPVLENEQLVAPSPVCHNGFITFGSYQGIHKITDETIKLWSRVVSEIPNARFRLQSSQLKYAEVLADTKKRFVSAGIDLERVQFEGHSDRQTYLASYAEVDVVLDTLPYPGGTTTAEALWMGVPTITMAGETMLSRQGVSMLSTVGLSQYVAESEDRFVAIAVQNAQNVSELVALRQSLRNTALNSALFDAPKFANDLRDCLLAIKASHSNN